MKKTLLTLIVGAAALTASADVVTFLAADATTSPLLEAVTGETVIIPEGFYFVTPADRKPLAMTAKTLSNDNVEIRGDIESETQAQAKIDDPTKDFSHTNYATSGGLRWYKYRTFAFTPAAGLTITKIRVRTQTTDNNGGIPGFTTDENNALLKTWTGSITTTTLFSPDDQNRCFWIEVTTEGTSTQVAKPVISVTEPYVVAGQQVSFSCSTEGATIHYAVVKASEVAAAIYTGTVDENNNPIYKDYVENITTYQEYTGPFTLTEDSYIRAYATKDGMTQSFAFYGDYYLVPDGKKIGKYNFDEWKSLVRTSDDGSYTDADLTDSFMASNGTKNKNIQDTTNGLSFKDNGTTMWAINGQIFMSKTFGGVTEFRLSSKADACFKITADDNISNIIFVGSYLTSIGVDATGTGTYTTGGTNSSMAMWTPAADSPTKEAIFNTSGTANYINQIYVFYNNPAAAIDEVDSDAIDFNAPVEYYNLQGMPVANPAGGLYIVRQGQTVKKLAL